MKLTIAAIEIIDAEAMRLGLSRSGVIELWSRRCQQSPVILSEFKPIEDTPAPETNPQS